ncbi:MAG: hypothetical protein V2B18_25705 [Pseudomonadota bacterium]
MNCGFHPDALDEYLSAVSYYADISSQLADSFIGAVESGIAATPDFRDFYSIP